MKRESTNKKVRRIVSIFITTVLITGGIFVYGPSAKIKNAEATPYVELSEDADYVSPPAMPPGWDNTQIGIPDGMPGTWGNTWQTTNMDFYSPPNSFFSGYEQRGYSAWVGDHTHYWGTFLPLISPSIDLTNASSANLTFMHRYDFIPEPWGPGPNMGFGISYGDGGMVFVTTDGGISWDWIEPEGGYPGAVGGEATWEYCWFQDVVGGILLHVSGENPWECINEFEIEGSGAFVGISGGWVPAEFDLSDYAGQKIQIAFGYTQNFELTAPEGSPNYGDGPGAPRPWLIDDITITKDTFDGPSIWVVGSDSAIVAQGGTHSYVLNVTNWKDVADTINLNSISNLGWSVEILDYTTYTPITDTGVLPANGSIWIRVNITAPLNEDWDVEELTWIVATSTLDPNKSSSEELYTSTPSPDVGVSWILVPPDRPPGLSVQITARIHNYGDFSRTFTVRCTVEGDLLIQPIVYNETGNPNEYNLVVDLPPGGSIDLTWNFTPMVESPYTITITTLLDIDQNPDNNESSGSIYIQTEAWHDDMEPPAMNSSAQRGEWTTWTNGAGTEWELGAPTLVGPPSAHDGTNCWGTDLNDFYVDGAQCILHTPMFYNLGSAASVIVKFWYWYEFDDPGGPNSDDWGYFGYENASNDNSITTVVDYSGASGGWVEEIEDMTYYTQGQSQIRFSWFLEEVENFNPGSAGFYIDNVTILATLPKPDLIITEIQDNDGAGNEYIEIYNQGNDNATLSDYQIQIDGVWISGVWSGTATLGVLQPKEYAIFTPIALDQLDDEGSQILLVNTTIPEGLVHDNVSYGQKGLVPDPVTGESVARWLDGKDYTDDWARESTPSIGSSHAGNETVYNPLVVLNEVYFNVDTGEPFIEIVYVGRAGDPDVDIAGWVVVIDGNPYTIPAGPTSTILNSTNKLFVVNATMAPLLFAEMTVGGDNVYLYNSTGSLVDMVGWSYPHSPGTAVARIPDGYGISVGFETYVFDGYDDPTSIEAGWQFVNSPTMGVISIEEDQKKVGDTGETVVYDLTIVNHGYQDVIDLLNQTFGEGWSIEIFDDTGATLLTDNNGNGIPDTGTLAPNETIIVKVKIYVPLQSPGNNMTSIITAVPGSNPFASDNATLITETYPHIEIDKYASQTEIWVWGSGPAYVPQETWITLNVRGAGLTQFIEYPQDVVFCIDASHSMENNDPMDERLAAAKNYVDSMKVPDRAAVVKYTDYAYLVDGPDDIPPYSGDNEHTVWNLSMQYGDIKNNIDECDDPPAGWTAIGASLKIAVNQLLDNGNASHVQAIILLSDGLAWDPTLAWQQAQIAAKNGILIYTIQLDPFSMLSDFTLSRLSKLTGGKHYNTTDPATLSDIYSEIGEELDEIAGRDLYVGDDVCMIQDVLPPYIDYVPGSFTVLPDDITVNATGYTFIEWEKQYIKINETWQCSFRIRSTLVGYLPANDFATSRVNYTKWNNETVEDCFPEVWLNVNSPMPEPPLLRIFYNGTNVILDWTPPNSPDTHHYLIYRSTSRDNFDFSSPWIDTNATFDPIDFAVIPARTTWNDTASFSPECYYIVRTVNSQGALSYTSNTVGKYDRFFPDGSSSFSLPLEPSYEKNVSWYIEQIGSQPTDYIKWWDSATQTWVIHYLSDGNGVNDDVMKIGQGYEIGLTSSTTYTFWGKPASSIRFLEGQLPKPDNFAVTANAAGDVFLSWDEVVGADHYIIYRATTREGLNNRFISFAAETTAFGLNAWMDPDPQTNIGGDEFYYVVGAVNSSMVHGTYNTTYAIGIWIGNYPAGYTAFGLPVKTFDSDTKLVDEYCDDIQNTVGINYHIYTQQRWGWHRINMPIGAYDEVLGYTNGYQLSAFADTEYNFVGR